MASPPGVLTIAATDSGGGAGIAADLRTFAALGVMGTLAVTAVTAQNTVSVTALEVLPAPLVTAQIEAVVADLHPVAAKTGVLASAEIVKAVAAKAEARALGRLVVDPVLVSSKGIPLFADAVRAAYVDLLARACVVTPNHLEAALLLGEPAESLASVDAMAAAARRLHALGPSLVIVKGGRLPGDEAIDVAYDGSAVTLLRAAWVETRNNHGTGCSLAAAIAAGLAHGTEPLQAATEAKAFVHKAIALAANWQVGAGHGPIDHFGAAAD
jgi:hydroxymethylpyrimidine/phosphomethylpyrimidine kinase